MSIPGTVISDPVNNPTAHQEKAADYIDFISFAPKYTPPEVEFFYLTWNGTKYICDVKYSHRRTAGYVNDQYNHYLDSWPGLPLRDGKTYPGGRSRMLDPQGNRFIIPTSEHSKVAVHPLPSAHHVAGMTWGWWLDNSVTPNVWRPPNLHKYYKLLAEEEIDHDAEHIKLSAHVAGLGLCTTSVIDKLNETLDSNELRGEAPIAREITVGDVLNLAQAKKALKDIAKVVNALTVAVVGLANSVCTDYAAHNFAARKKKVMDQKAVVDHHNRFIKKVHSLIEEYNPGADIPVTSARGFLDTAQRVLHAEDTNDD